MIDNNNKSSLHNGWNMRIIVIYFSNGLKKIFRKTRVGLYHCYI